MKKQRFLLIFHVLDSPKIDSKSMPTCIRKKHRKKHQKNRFWLPFWPPKTFSKPTQNAFKIDVPKNMLFFIDFCSKKPSLQKGQPLIFAGMASVLLAFHTIQRFAFCMRFGCKKPLKKHSKTRCKPLKNRC